EQLSYHAHRGEVWDKALTYLRQAGAKAVARSADREAVAWFEQALDTLTHLPDSRDRLQQAIDLRFSLRASLFRLGEFGRILGHLREAETLARTIDDQPRLGQVYSHLINYYLATAEHDRALESGQRALAIANDLNDVNLELVTNFHLGQVYASLGEYRRAVASIRTFVQSLRSDPRREGFDQSARLVLSSTWLAWWLAELGEFAEGTTIGEETVRVAEAVDQPFERLVAYLGMGLLHLRKGDFHKAIPALERSLPLCRIGDLVLWSPAIASPLGYAYALSGRLGEAIPLLERAVEETMLLRRVGHALRMAHLSEAFLLAERPDDAARLAAQALDLCRKHKERGHQAYVLRLLGEIASHHDSPQIEEAEDAYRQARALAEELGMRPLLAHCHLGLGGLHARLGRAEAARAALSTAIRLFGSMEMAFWLDRAEAMLAKVGGAP
ncbi:MAG: tetratricopeptide repeat protein, partial [Candidatus Rokubacteria bacterium]|nr:tetratricopeptide repeat protein [Candidatus Rokubacteria bacterium]